MSRPSDRWQRRGLILSCPIHVILAALKTYLQVSVKTCERFDNAVSSFNQEDSSISTSGIILINCRILLFVAEIVELNEYLEGTCITFKSNEWLLLLSYYVLVFIPAE